MFEIPANDDADDRNCYEWRFEIQEVTDDGWALISFEGKLEYKGMCTYASQLLAMRNPRVVDFCLLWPIPQGIGELSSQRHVDSIDSYS